MKVATKKFVLLRKLSFLFENMQYKITRRIFNAETWLRNISHEVVITKSEVGLPVFWVFQNQHCSEWWQILNKFFVKEGKRGNATFSFRRNFRWLLNATRNVFTKIVKTVILGNQWISVIRRSSHEFLSFKTFELPDMQKLREADYIWRARLFKRFCATVCRDEVDVLLNYFTHKARIYWKDHVDTQNNRYSLA